MNAARQIDRSWSTKPFLAETKMAGWNDIVARNMTELDVSAEDPDRFSAHWRQFGLDPIELNFIEAESQLVRRTPQMVNRSGAATFELVHMQRGSMVIREGPREEFIRQGDFALLCNSVPYEFECSGRSLALTAHISESWLRAWLPAPDALRAVPAEARMAWGQPLGSLLRAISQQGLGDIALPRSVLADQIGSLLNLIGGRRAQPADRGRRATLERVRELLRERCLEPNLSPVTLAEQAGISRRHLHGLFASEGSTFGAELMELRLQHAARLLRQNAQRAKPVSEVAFGVGFADTSHFARRFRRRFGCSPSQWQARDAN